MFGLGDDPNVVTPSRSGNLVATRESQHSLARAALASLEGRLLFHGGFPRKSLSVKLNLSPEQFWKHVNFVSKTFVLNAPQWTWLSRLVGHDLEDLAGGAVFSDRLSNG